MGANGAGKSTILDALTFALFSKHFRKINKPQLLNSINQSDCVVELEFDVGKNKYKVVRGIKPAKFEIYQLILELAKKNKGIIIISSEMPELLGITDRILVMSNGRAAGIVNTKDTSQNEILELASRYL